MSGKMTVRLRSLRRMIARARSQLVCHVANGWRWLRRGQIPAYPVIVLDGELVERTPQQPWWVNFVSTVRQPPTSLEALDQALHRIAGDPATRGVVLIVRAPDISLPQAQSFTALFERFRQWDRQYNGSGNAKTSAHQPKQIVAYIEETDMRGYLAICTADRVYMTPLTNWSVLGLRTSITYLKDTLARLGLAFDVVQIAPWKTAGDIVNRSSMSEESRAQLNWLLDSLYADLVCLICQGRNLSEARVRELIDCAPLHAEDALNAGLVDGVVYEDELALLLSHDEKHGKKHNEKDAGKKARLKRYDDVKGLMKRHPRVAPRQVVGVISLSGSIVPGRSRELPVPLPLLGRQQIGSQTVQQQVRAVRENAQVAAVVLHVDSPGGSALASDLMWRELMLLAAEKPLVVYMGNVAASGGYYIAAPAHEIVAQRATLTGSIGVITLKPNAAGTFHKLHANVETMQRGANADIFSPDCAWDTAQRAHIEESVRYLYGEFKQRVADGRNLPYETLDPICNGRVWTGIQAHDRGLVDAVGDIHTAIRRACQLAELSVDGSTRVVNLHAAKGKRVAQPLAESEEAHALNTLRDLGQLAVDMARGDWEVLLGHERCWFIADGLPKLR